MFRKKKARLSGGSEAEASLYARWIRESIPRAIRLHNAIGSGPFEGLLLWRLNGQEMAAPKVREMQGQRIDESGAIFREGTKTAQGARDRQISAQTSRSYGLAPRLLLEGASTPESTHHSQPLLALPGWAGPPRSAIPWVRPAAGLTTPAPPPHIEVRCQHTRPLRRCHAEMRTW